MTYERFTRAGRQRSRVERATKLSHASTLPAQREKRRGRKNEIFQNILLLTLSELQSRFGDKPLKFQVICLQLSPKRDCGPKRV